MRDRVGNPTLCATSFVTGQRSGFMFFAAYAFNAKCLVLAFKSEKVHSNWDTHIQKFRVDGISSIKPPQMKILKIVIP